MQCEEIEEVCDAELQENEIHLKDLDTALKELGMLATSTNSRKEYMKEISPNPCTSSLKINTKYISNVVIGCGKCKTKANTRFTPYIPRARNRTKSENNDSESFSIIHKVLKNDALNCVEDFTQLKKAKSLESIIAESKEQVDFNEINFEILPELEVVSECIQNLKFVE